MIRNTKSPPGQKPKEKRGKVRRQLREGRNGRAGSVVELHILLHCMILARMSGRPKVMVEEVRLRGHGTSAKA